MVLIAENLMVSKTDTISLNGVYRIIVGEMDINLKNENKYI